MPMISRASRFWRTVRQLLSMVRVRWQVWLLLLPRKVSRDRHTSVIQVSSLLVLYPLTATSISSTQRSRWVSTESWLTRVGWTSLRCSMVASMVYMERCTSWLTSTMLTLVSLLWRTPQRHATAIYSVQSSAILTGLRSCSHLILCKATLSAWAVVHRSQTIMHRSVHC